VSAPVPGWEAVLSSGLGSNDAILKGILSFKISRFIDCNATYPVEIAICSCQLRETLYTHKDNDKGILPQHPSSVQTSALACTMASVSGKYAKPLASLS
jgi:hypothetical protein